MERTQGAMPDLDRMAAHFQTLFGGGNPEAFFAPGRVNLIGEHTDHEGGHVFPCAIAFGIWALACRSDRPKKTVRLCSLNFEDKGVMEAPLRGLEYDAARGWANYPLGVLRVLEAHGHALPAGLDLLFWGNLPEGAGLSSSAAIEVLTARIANDLFDLGLDGVRLALLSQEAENKFIGVQCGIMDQFAVSMGKKDHAILLDCAKLEYRYAPLALGGCKLVITNSNVPHSLGSSEYNLRRQQCEEALADIARVRPNLKKLCELSVEEFDAVKDAIRTPPALRRARHAITEDARTLRAVEALGAGDLRTFGELMKLSHLSLRDDYEVTIPELDTLAELAWAQAGVVGSRMTGAGFGGCTVSIVEGDAVQDFIHAVGEGYTARTGRTASFYVTETADGAGKIHSLPASS